MIDNEVVIESQKAALQRTANELVGELRREQEVTKTGYESLLSELKEAEAEVIELDRLAIDYRVLERKLDVQRQIFDVVAEQLTTTDISSQFDMASIRILDAAGLPSAPYAPDPIKAAALAGFLSCLHDRHPCWTGISGQPSQDFLGYRNLHQKPVYGDIMRVKNTENSALLRPVSTRTKTWSSPSVPSTAH